ncbi:hypothetical protein QPX96_01120 [Limosilactobacillus fermentum]|nr:hypothetical protein [Limosilactobacillus fermentum]
MKKTGDYLGSPADLDGVVSVTPQPVAGAAIGIIAVNLVYPKLPGNVANASTFAFPVDYEVIDLAIEQLFEADPGRSTKLFKRRSGWRPAGCGRSSGPVATLLTFKPRSKQPCGCRSFCRAWPNYP